MDKTVVVYKSKYGATKKYAEWIASELKADVFEFSTIASDKLQEYSTIVFGGGVYAGSINGIKIISKNINELKDKNIVIFTCGMANPKNEAEIKGIKENLNVVFAEMKNSVSFFHLRGSIDFGELSFGHKLIMSMVIKILRKNDPEAFSGKNIDFIDKTTIAPIVEYCKNL